MGERDRLLIVDLDDTLIQTQPKYEDAKQAVAEYLFDTMDPDRYDTPDEIVDDVLDAEDAQRYAATGVPATRFRDSCIHTVYDVATTIQKEENRTVDTDTVEQAVMFAEQQGMKPLIDYSEDDLLPGARDALQYAEEQGDDVAIMTKGADDVQQIKLAATGLDDVDTYIVDDKDADAFDTVISDRDPDSVWMVGNSVRSDVHPMLDYGGNVLLIADAAYTATWRGEEADHPLPEDGPWFRGDGLDRFVDEHYPVIDAFDAAGDITVLQDHR